MAEEHEQDPSAPPRVHAPDLTGGVDWLNVPAPLTIGRVVLADGTDVAGFLCEPIALDGAPDITRFGGWRAYRAATPG